MLDGSGTGTIISYKPMTNGVIRIKSESTANEDGVQIHNKIKDINLVSNVDNTTITDPRDNRGILLENSNDGWDPANGRGNDFKGSNYHTNITGSTINGFSTGLHMRGFSNATTVSNLVFENIHSYGVWLSGNADNAFSKLNFKNCPNASAIRVDNSVDDRFQGFELPQGPTIFSVDDPNCVE